MPRPSSPADWSILAKADQRALAAAVAFGQRNRLARLEAQVPAALADPGRRHQLRLAATAPCPAALERHGLGIGALADQQRQVGHLRDRHPVEHHSFGVDQGQPVLVLPQRRRFALDDVDHQRVGKTPRHARILDPAELQQPLANVGDVDQRHGGGLLVERDLIDRARIHPLDALDVDALHPEAGIADRLSRRQAQLGRDIERDQRRRRRSPARTGRTPRRPGGWPGPARPAAWMRVSWERRRAAGFFGRDRPDAPRRTCAALTSPLPPSSWRPLPRQ